MADKKKSLGQVAYEVYFDQPVVGSLVSWDQVHPSAALVWETVAQAVKAAVLAEQRTRAPQTDLAATLAEQRTQAPRPEDLL